MNLHQSGAYSDEFTIGPVVFEGDEIGVEKIELMDITHFSKF